MSQDENGPITHEPSLELPPSTDAPNTGGLLLESDALGQTTAKLAALEGIQALLTLDLPFEDFARELLLAIMRAVPSEAGSIFEIDHEQGCFIFRTSVGTASDKLDRFTVPLGKGIVGHVAESRLPLIVANAEENRQHLRVIADAVGFETRNLVAVPLVIRGRVFGVLELLNRLGEENYSQADVELLTYVCEAAARAIEVRLMIGWALRRLEAAEAAVGGAARREAA